MGKGHSSKPSQTPAEQQANVSAGQYLQQFNSGKLTAADQANVDVNSNGSLATLLQQFSGSGMGNSSLMALMAGKETKDANGLEQAGAGSQLDLMKVNTENDVLNSYQKIGQAYLQIASGQAADLGALQEEQIKARDQAWQKVGSSIGSLLGNEMATSQVSAGAAQTSMEDSQSNVLYPSEQFSSDNNILTSPYQYDAGNLFNSTPWMSGTGMGGD